MQNTKHFAMGGIFTAIVLLGFQSFYTPNQNLTKNGSEKIIGYNGNEPNAGGQSISVGKAKDFISAFQTANPGFNGREGFFIGKSAIEALLNSDLNNNGIVFCPAINDANEITMVICATYSPDARVTSNNSGVYMAESFCPSICGVFSK